MFLNFTKAEYYIQHLKHSILHDALHELQIEALFSLSYPCPTR
jgi:hypothetical protein